MRDYGTAIETHLAAGEGVAPRHLLWIEAKNRTTGEIEATGFWNGKDTREFVVNGETRTYFGAGALLGIDPIIGSVGLNVRMQRVRLAQVAPEVMQAIRGYDVRLAPVEIHRVHIDPVKGVQIGAPVRVFKGSVDEAPIPKPAVGQEASLEMTLASAARALTRTLTAKKSDAAQRRIDPTDRGREYATISGAVGVFWGVLHKRGAPPPTAPVFKGDDPGRSSDASGDNRG
jgi:hypothetical protein